MQRRLILMRHAKSDWKAGVQSDHERPLNARGRRDAPRVAAFLHQLGWIPEGVWSSDSTRTRQTWELMAGALFDPPATFTPKLYHDGFDAIMGEAAAWTPAWRTLLVLGHNPFWAAAITQLSGARETLPTGAAALLEGAGTSWPTALAAPWRLVQLIRPKALRP